MKLLFILTIFASMLLVFSCKKTNTAERPINLPVITTMPVSAIEDDRAISGFTITNNDTITILERGIVWSRQTSPVLETASKASINVDTPTHAFYISEISCSTRYFVRAFIKTLAHGTLYGNQVEFTTNSLSSYTKSLKLSKTNFTDTIIEKNLSIENGVGFIYTMGFINELILPQGVYFYVKFDFVDNNVTCNSGSVSRFVYTGDTVHFAKRTPGGYPGVGMEANVFINGMGDLQYSKAIFSIHAAGLANTSDSDYHCNYKIRINPTRTTGLTRYVTDTSTCSNTCVF